MSVPSRLGKYEIRRELGKGTMGVVYEAFDPVIQRRVAIKVIRQDQFNGMQAEDQIARLRREAQAAGRLSHPGIVSVYDFGEDATLGGNGIAFIAMELIEGRELKQLQDEGRRFTAPEAARIIGAVLAALAHAHERGVTHRDIKPANVMLLADGSVKVADFGVARIESSELTQAGTLIGTPQYMSPEQLLGLTVDGRSDLFACGVLLYELLTGQKPFTGSMTTVIQKVLNQTPEPPSRLDPALGTAWDRVVALALAKKPDDRFASAAAMADAVRAAAADYAADATLVRGPSDAAPAVRPGAGSRRGQWLAALGALAVSAGAAMWWLRPVPPVASAPTPAAASSARPTVADALPAGPPAASASGSGADWASAIARVRSVKAPLTLTTAFGALLDPLSDFERLTLADFQSALERRPGQVAMALGARKGQFVFWTASRPDAAAAAEAARADCEKNHATPCRVLLAHGQVEPDALLDAAQRLTTESRPQVRTALLKAMAESVARYRQTETAAREPSNMADWASRVGRLQAAKAPLSLAAALAILIDPLSEDQRRTLADFEAAQGRRAPSTAIAMGVKDGYLAYRTLDAQPAAAVATATEQACTQRHGIRCRVVFVDGQTRRDPLVAVARELGSRPVEQVRAALLRAFGDSLVSYRQQAPAAAASGPATAARLRESLDALMALGAPTITPATRESIIGEYEGWRSNKSIALAPSKGTWKRWADGTSPAVEEESALEGCQVFYGQPCATLAVNDRVLATTGGNWQLKDMPRVRYAGAFDPKMVPIRWAYASSDANMVQYSAARGPKAAAFHPWGHLFMEWNHAGQTAAEQRALERCNNEPNRKGRDGPCFLYAVGDQVVLPKRLTKPQ